MDISPDGSTIVSGSADGYFKIWDFNTGNLLAAFSGANSGAVTAVAWSPNGDKVATGNEQSDVVLWDVSGVNGAEIPSGANDIGLGLFPNPVSDELSVRLSEDISVEQMTICDIRGRIVASLRPADASFSVGHLLPGLYYLSVQTTESKRAIQPFVKY